MISLGLTTRPSSSILRTILLLSFGAPPAHHILYNMPIIWKVRLILCIVRACFCQCFIQPCQQGITAEQLGNVGVHACFKHLFLRFPSSHLHFGDIITERRVNFKDIGFLPAK